MYALRQLEEITKDYNDYFGREHIKSSEAIRTLCGYIKERQPSDPLIHSTYNTYVHKSSSNFSLLPSFLTKRKVSKEEKQIQKNSQQIDKSILEDRKTFGRGQIIYLYGKFNSNRTLKTSGYGKYETSKLMKAFAAIHFAYENQLSPLMVHKYILQEAHSILHYAQIKNFTLPSEM